MSCAHLKRLTFSITCARRFLTAYLMIGRITMTAIVILLNGVFLVKGRVMIGLWLMGFSTQRVTNERFRVTLVAESC